MFAIVMTIFCSTSIALLLKYNDTRVGQPLVLLTGNYLIASIISLIFLIEQGKSVFSFDTFMFGVIVAIIFTASFFIFAKAVAVSGTALAQTSSRLSVAVPVLFSMLMFKESPTIMQISGIFLAFITIFLFYVSVHKNSKEDDHGLTKYLYLVLLFIGIGLGDFSMKIFQGMRPMTEKPFFLFIIFTYSFFICITILLIKKIPVLRPTLYLGMFLGVPNVFSSYFILSALTLYPAVVVYPFINIGIIVLTSVLAYLIWKEKLGFWGILSLSTGVLAIILLSS